MSDRNHSARLPERSLCRCDTNIPPWHRRSRPTFISLPARSVIRKLNRCEAPATHPRKRFSGAPEDGCCHVSHETSCESQHRPTSMAISADILLPLEDPGPLPGTESRGYASRPTPPDRSLSRARRCGVDRSAFLAVMSQGMSAPSVRGGSYSSWGGIPSASRTPMSDGSTEHTGMFHMKRRADIEWPPRGVGNRTTAHPYPLADILSHFNSDVAWSRCVVLRWRCGQPRSGCARRRNACR